MELKEYFAFAFVIIFYITAVVPCIGCMFTERFSSYREDFMFGVVIHLILMVIALSVWAMSVVFNFYTPAP